MKSVIKIVDTPWRILSQQCWWWLWWWWWLIFIELTFLRHWAKSFMHIVSFYCHYNPRGRQYYAHLHVNSGDSDSATFLGSHRKRQSQPWNAGLSDSRIWPLDPDVSLPLYKIHWRLNTVSVSHFFLAHFCIHSPTNRAKNQTGAQDF